jgi:hypothetical protein
MPKRISKKDLALTFLAFFLIFAFIGYLRGRAVRNSPDRLRWDILARLELLQANGEKLIVYRCNGAEPVSWNIDKDKISSELPSTRTDGETLWPTIFQNDSIMYAFLTGGGAASVFTARELLAIAASGGSNSKLINQKYVKLIAVAILGAISGYELGYQIAMHSNSNCADIRFNDILNNQGTWRGDGTNWQGLERTYFLLCVDQLEKETPETFCKLSDPALKAEEENKFSLARAEYVDFKRGAMLIDHDIAGTDFDSLIKYRTSLRQYVARCGS